MIFSSSCGEIACPSAGADDSTPGWKSRSAPPRPASAANIALPLHQAFQQHLTAKRWRYRSIKRGRKRESGSAKCTCEWEQSFRKPMPPGQTPPATIRSLLTIYCGTLLASRIPFHRRRRSGRSEWRNAGSRKPTESAKLPPRRIRRSAPPGDSRPSDGSYG